MYVIARNTITDHLRADRGIVLLPDCGPFARFNIEPGERITEEEHASAMAKKIDEILNAIPSKYGSVLRLQFLEGLLSEEAAEYHGIKRGTVRWRAHRARKLFKEEWLKRFAVPEEET